MQLAPMGALRVHPERQQVPVQRAHRSRAVLRTTHESEGDMSVKDQVLTVIVVLTVLLLTLAALSVLW